MAREVRETPILKGADAQRFEKTIKSNEGKKVSSTDYERAMETYNHVTVK